MEDTKRDLLDFDTEFNATYQEEPKVVYPKELEVTVPDNAKFQSHLDQLRREGATEETIQAAIKNYKELYNRGNPAMTRRDDVTPQPSQAEINAMYTKQVEDAKDGFGAKVTELLVKAQEELEEKRKNNPPALLVEDLSNMAHPYLTASARHDLAQKAYQLTVVQDGRVFTSIYLATRVIKGDEERAVQYLAKVINDLSQRGLIHSTLASISSLDLAISSLTLQSVVFCFVLIPSESHKDVQNMYPEFVMQEGDVGRELYDLSPILSPGEFTTTIRISHVMNVLQKTAKDIREQFQDELNQYIALLPKGTRVRKVVQLAISGLSVDFEVKFYNELLPNVKKVQIEYRRACTPVGESIKQFAVLTGITYSDKDGNFLYK